MFNLLWDYIGHVDDTLGRYIFKNNCGLTGNFTGKICYYLARRAYEDKSRDLEPINYLDYEFEEDFIDNSGKSRKNYSAILIII